MELGKTVDYSQTDISLVTYLKFNLFDYIEKYWVKFERDFYDL